MEIRVGEDGAYLENNRICLGQIDLRATGAANITCLQTLFGDWISVEKSSSLLSLGEVRVFGSTCKYSSSETHTHIILRTWDLILAYIAKRALDFYAHFTVKLSAN